MKDVAHARFTIMKWDEKPYSEGQDLPKLTRAAVTKAFTGDIAGEGHVDYLMMYRSDGSATFVGLERIVGHQERPAASCSNARANSKMVWRRSRTSSLPAPARENFTTSAARGRRHWGTVLSTRSRCATNWTNRQVRREHARRAAGTVAESGADR